MEARDPSSSSTISQSNASTTHRVKRSTPASHSSTPNNEVMRELERLKTERTSKGRPIWAPKRSHKKKFDDEDLHYAAKLKSLTKMISKALCERLAAMHDNIHESWIDFDENDNEKQIDQTINEVVHTVMHNPSALESNFKRKKPSEGKRKEKEARLNAYSNDFPVDDKAANLLRVNYSSMGKNFIPVEHENNPTGPPNFDALSTPLREVLKIAQGRKADHSGVADTWRAIIQTSGMSPKTSLSPPLISRNRISTPVPLLSTASPDLAEQANVVSSTVASPPEDAHNP